MHLLRTGLGALFSIAVILPTTALAENSGWYVAVDGGQSQFNDASSQVPSWLASLPNPPGYVVGINGTSGTSNDDHHAAYRFMLGYQINPYWGVEASYVDLGTASVAGTASGYYQPSCQKNQLCLPIVGITSFGYKGSYRDRGPGLAFNGTYPISDQWSVFARLGMVDARVHLDLETSPSLPPASLGPAPLGATHSSTNWSSTFGLGVNYTLNDRWAVRLGWDRYADLGSRNNTGSNSVNLASIGVVYRI